MGNPKKKTIFTVKSFYEHEILDELEERFDAVYLVALKYIGPRNEHQRIVIRKKKLEEFPQNPVDLMTMHIKSSDIKLR